MKNQVTSIEQSKRLIEMGVPAEKASMRWFQELEYEYESRTWVPTNDRFIQLPRQEFPIDYETFYPAFTVADLLEVMPKEISAEGEQNHDYFLTLSHCFCWKLCYEHSRTHRRIGEEVDFNLVDILCNRIEWLLSNGYKLEV